MVFLKAIIRCLLQISIDNIANFNQNVQMAK